MLLAGFGGGFGSDGPGFGGAFGTGSGRGKIANNTDIADILTSQWGWGYGSGTTAILYKNSPAGWLSSINTYITGTFSSRLDSIYKYTYQQWGWDYGTSSVYYYSDSPAGWLNNVSGKVNSFFPAMNNTLADISARINLIRVPVETYMGASFNTLADISARTNLIRQAVETYIGPIFNNVVDVSARIALVRSELLSIKDLLSRANDMALADSSLLSKGFADVLAKMDNINVSVSLPSVTVDMSGVESRLDDIKNLLLLAGTKDIIDAILGDLDDLASAALLGEVQAAAQDAFPFCIPFVVKQLLGLVESDPAAPEFDFVIGGETMHVDLAFAQGFVDILGWACRFLLVFGLVVSSRRFIYTGAVS